MRSRTRTPSKAARTAALRRSPEAPAITKAPMKSSHQSIHNPTTIMATPMPYDTSAAMAVARTGPRRLASSARSTRPPSIGMAGRRLNPARTTFIQPRRASHEPLTSVGGHTPIPRASARPTSRAPRARLVRGPTMATRSSPEGTGDMRSISDMPPIGSSTMSFTVMPRRLATMLWASSWTVTDANRATIQSPSTTAAEVPPPAATMSRASRRKDQWTRIGTPATVPILSEPFICRSRPFRCPAPHGSPHGMREAHSAARPWRRPPTGTCSATLPAEAATHRPGPWRLAARRTSPRPPPGRRGRGVDDAARRSVARATAAPRADGPHRGAGALQLRRQGTEPLQPGVELAQEGVDLGDLGDHLGPQVLLDRQSLREELRLASGVGGTGTVLPTQLLEAVLVGEDGPDLVEVEPEQVAQLLDPGHPGEVCLGIVPGAARRAASRPEETDLLVVAQGALRHPEERRRPADRQGRLARLGRLGGRPGRGGSCWPAPRWHARARAAPR